MRPSRFFVVFLLGYSLLTAGAWLVAGAGGGIRSGNMGGMGMYVFGAMMIPLLLGTRIAGRPELILTLIALNNLLISAIATGIYVVVRKLRAA